MKVAFQWPIKLKKKQAELPAFGERSEWIPYSSNWPPTNAAKLGTTARCLKLYSDFLLQTELEPKDHYLAQLLAKPNRWQDKRAFYETLVYETFLNGNLYCVIESNSQGQVTGLLPYRSGQCFAYPGKSGGDYSDPVSLQQNGLFYRDYKGRVWLESEIWHLKDSLYNNADQINGVARVAVYQLLFGAGYSVQAVQSALAQSHLKPPFLLSGMPTEQSANIKAVRDTIEKFFNQGHAQGAGACLSLPQGFDLKPLMTANPERILEFLSKRSDLDVCKIMGVPYQLISDGESSSGTNTLKEALRYFIKFSIQPMLQSIAQSLSALAMDGTQFYL